MVTDGFNLSLKNLRKKISELSVKDQLRLLLLVENEYRPQVRALVGLLFSCLNLFVPESLALSLNSATTYKLNLNTETWPTAGKWNIR